MLVAQQGEMTTLGTVRASKKSGPWLEMQSYPLRVIRQKLIGLPFAASPHVSFPVHPTYNSSNGLHTVCPHAPETLDHGRATTIPAAQVFSDTRSLAGTIRAPGFENKGEVQETLGTPGSGS